MSQSLLAEIAAERERADELEAEVEGYREALKPFATERLAVRRWGLPAKAAVVLHMLVANGHASYEAMHQALPGAANPIAGHRVLIAGLRAALRPHGVDIRNLSGWGYFVEVDDRQRLQRLVDEAGKAVA